MTRTRKIDPSAFLSPKKSAEAFAADVAELRRVLRYIPETGEFQWLVSRSGYVKAGVRTGSVNSSGYVNVNLLGRTFGAHRLAFLFVTGRWPAYQVDHLNGIRVDNRWCNLREVTNVLNMQNQRRANSRNVSGFLGVSFQLRRPSPKKYRAVIREPSGKDIFLGWHLTAEEAHAAYLTAKRRLHEGCTL